MNAALRAQLARLAEELAGELIPLYDDERCAVVCFVPSLEPPTNARVEGGERVAAPVLVHLDGRRARVFADPDAATIAEAMGRGERLTARH